MRDGSTGTTIRNLTMVGNNHQAGTSEACCSRENNHGIAVLSAVDTLIEDVDMSRIWGDCLYVNRADGGVWSDGVRCVTRPAGSTGATAWASSPATTSAS